MIPRAAARWAVCGVALLSLACRGQPAPPQHAEMARDQIFFAAQTPEPVLLALILQRTRTPTEPTTALEVKAFLVARNRLQSLFWERVSLDTWPGDDLDAVLTAWQAQRKGPALRLDFAVQPTTLDVSVRQPSGGFALHATRLSPLGKMTDPHGMVSLRAGSAALEVNGETWHGPVLAEQLAPESQAWPTYGQFEMWLAAAPDGALWLGRNDLMHHSGQAAVVPLAQPARLAAFPVAVTRSRVDVPTGFALPNAWNIALEAPVALVRQTGEPSRGHAPNGGPAVYDISVATGPQTTALVFHLQDH